MKNRILIICAIIPILALTLVFINHLRYKPIIIKPQNSGWTIKTYDDSIEDSLGTGNFTTIDTFAYNSEAVIFKATLGEGAKFPFGGMNFLPKSGEIDVRGYDYFILNLLPGCSDFTFTATLSVPGLSDSADIETHKYHQKDFAVSKETSKLKITFNELPTPSWWYSQNNIKREDLPETDKSHFSSISISNHLYQKRGEHFTLHLGSIEIRRSYKNDLIAIVISILLSLVILTIYGIFFREKKYIAIKPTDIKENNKISAVMEFIGENYGKKGVSLEEVAKSCDLTTYQVRKEISDKYSCTFNEYLRKIRIEEGARLLKESDVDIKQIAYEVGFSHPTSFNRAFKQEKKVSPSEFRNL